MDSITPSKFARTAAVFELDPIQCLRARYRYLKQQTDTFRALYLQYQRIDPYFWWWHDAAMQMIEVVSYAKQLKTRPKYDDDIDAMVARAKEYPIANLFGDEIRVIAFCHDDKTPSLHINSAKNVCFCNPCGKAYNPIDILMERDGMGFIDAVKFLQ